MRHAEPSAITPYNHKHERILEARLAQPEAQAQQHLPPLHLSPGAVAAEEIFIWVAAQSSNIYIPHVALESNS
jgi:hypothetical protein